MNRAVLTLALSGALCVAGCPKDKSPASSTTTPTEEEAVSEPTPEPSAWAILTSDSPGADAPSEARVESSAAKGTVVLVEAPASLLASPPAPWSLWAELGTTEAVAPLGSAGWLLSAAAKGDDPVAVYLSFTPPEAADADTIRATGAVVNTVAKGVVTAQVPPSAWRGLLALEGLTAIEAAGVVGKRTKGE